MGANMNRCKIHDVFTDDCVSCLLQRISALESELDAINTIAHDANAAIDSEKYGEIEKYKQMLNRITADLHDQE